MSLPILAWFSAGAPSAVAARLAVHEYGAENVTILNTDVGSEHPDNARFIRDVSEWIGVPVGQLKSEKYRDTWQVWEERRFLVGPAGALCTTELKKKPRWAVQKDYGAQVYGYTAEPRERARADRFRVQNPEVELLTPLIDKGLTKGDCLAIIEDAGIAIPAMYALGYANNNCIVCVKGGMGYWNKIRRDFPDTFDRMAVLERNIGHSLLSDNTGPVWLGDLDPTRGRYEDEPDIECSLLCAAVEDELDSTS